MEKVEKKYYYSEIFHSIQGEGEYTGVPTAWIRFFLCNLQCNGFGQKDPTNPDTYELPFENFDVSTIKRVEDLPVWDKGCDSSYTWAKKFKGLMGQETPSVLADKIVDAIKTDWKHFIIITNGNPKEYIVSASATDSLDALSKLPLSNKLLIINSEKNIKVNIDGIENYTVIFIAISN